MHSNRVSPDGTSWRFLLRENGRWSNGDRVTAKDFLGSWRRVLEPKTAAQYAYQLFAVQGAKDYNQGKLKTARTQFVRALNFENSQKYAEQWIKVVDRELE